jgi:hypothetical protein
VPLKRGKCKSSNIHRIHFHYLGFPSMLNKFLHTTDVAVLTGFMKRHHLRLQKKGITNIAYIGDILVTFCI